MKKLLLLVTSFVLGFVLIGCSSSSKEEKKGIDVEKLESKQSCNSKKLVQLTYLTQYY